MNKNNKKKFSIKFICVSSILTLIGICFLSFSNWENNNNQIISKIEKKAILKKPEKDIFKTEIKKYGPELLLKESFKISKKLSDEIVKMKEIIIHNNKTMKEIVIQYNDWFLQLNRRIHELESKNNAPINKLNNVEAEQTELIRRESENIGLEIIREENSLQIKSKVKPKYVREKKPSPYIFSEDFQNHYDYF